MGGALYNELCSIQSGVLKHGALYAMGYVYNGYGTGDSNESTALSSVTASAS
jgi:hypothetical protein